jgi:hypothetical protein
MGKFMFREKNKQTAVRESEVNDLICVISHSDANCDPLLFISTVLPQMLPNAPKADIDLNTTPASKYRAALLVGRSEYTGTRVCI